MRHATRFFFLLPFVVLVGYTLVLVIPELQSFFGEGGLGAAYLSQFQELQGGSPPGPLADLGFSEVLAMGPAEVIDLLRNATVQSWLGRVSDTLIGALSPLTSLLLRVFIGSLDVLPAERRTAVCRLVSRHLRRSVSFASTRRQSTRNCRQLTSETS